MCCSVTGSQLVLTPDSGFFTLDLPSDPSREVALSLSLTCSFTSNRLRLHLMDGITINGLTACEAKKGSNPSGLSKDSLSSYSDGLCVLELGKRGWYEMGPWRGAIPRAHRRMRENEAREILTRTRICKPSLSPALYDG